MRKFFGLVVLFALIALGSATSALASAPMLTPLDGGSMPALCVAASAADAPAFGQAMVGSNGNFVVYDDGAPTNFRIAEEGRSTGQLPALIVEPGQITAPACGSTDDASNGVTFVNGLCFAQSSRNTPPHTQCVLGD